MKKWFLFVHSAFFDLGIAYGKNGIICNDGSVLEWKSLLVSFGTSSNVMSAFSSRYDQTT